ncbi:hypothetical protein HC776_03615 [bacterium]|nr:hypothetical protein [bacterium]
MIEVHVTLYAMFFAFISAFMILVACGLFLVGSMRVVRLNNQGPMGGLSPLVIRQNLQQVASPLDQLTPWYTPSPFETGTHPAVSAAANHTPGPLILPLRVQDTLLYADSLSQR